MKKLTALSLFTAIACGPDYQPDNYNLPEVDPSRDVETIEQGLFPLTTGTDDKLTGWRARRTWPINDFSIVRRPKEIKGMVGAWSNNTQTAVGTYSGNGLYVIQTTADVNVYNSIYVGFVHDKAGPWGFANDSQVRLVIWSNPGQGCCGGPSQFTYAANHTIEHGGIIPGPTPSVPDNRHQIRIVFDPIGQANRRVRVWVFAQEQGSWPMSQFTLFRDGNPPNASGTLSFYWIGHVYSDFTNDLGNGQFPGETNPAPAKFSQARWGMYQNTSLFEGSLGVGGTLSYTKIQDSAVDWAAGNVSQSSTTCGTSATAPCFEFGGDGSN